MGGLEEQWRKWNQSHPHSLLHYMQYMQLSKLHSSICFEHNSALKCRNVLSNNVHGWQRNCELSEHWSRKTFSGTTKCNNKMKKWILREERLRLALDYSSFNNWILLFDKGTFENKNYVGGRTATLILLLFSPLLQDSAESGHFNRSAAFFPE